ncbi:MAG: sodium:proton exchanger [Thiovulaceae bacterium]|nr:sodium:proton exchanger [Sulfurimonadaceae bacterium]
MKPAPSWQIVLSALYNQHSAVILGTLFGLLTFVFHYLHNPYLALIFAAVSIVLLSLTVSQVAEVLALRLDEPYGSLVLTFSAVIVEIILLFLILLEAGHNPHAMETVKGGIISAVIVDMNVLLGLAVFIGGLAFKEQEHNEDTSSTYTTILLVAASALLVPSILHFTTGNNEGLASASLLIGAVLFIFYIAIFIFQTKTHSHFFKSTARSRMFRLKNRQNEDSDGQDDEVDVFEKMSSSLNFIALFVLIAVIGYIAEIFATEGMQLVIEYSFPVGLAGLIIAIISVSPEIITAIKAAKNDQIQRVINIAMGASTVSIMLTVPILLAMSYATENPLTLDFNTLQIGALILTIMLAWKTTDDGETNYFEGTSHLIIFACYTIVLAFM